jgi:5-methylcytosine-specific restriction endonuclease McrA
MVVVLLERTRSIKRTRTQLKSCARRSKRETLLARDGSTCWICGYKLVHDAPALSPLRTSLDHVVEVADGGSNRNENLRLAHAVCNNVRGQVYAALTQGTPIARSRVEQALATYGTWAAQFDQEGG